MREKKISTNKIKEDHSKKLLLNVSILILIVINAILAYSVVKTISSNDTEDYLLVDSTKARIQVEVLNGCGVSGVAENLGNYRSFEIENSIIIGRNEKIYNAKKVAAIVGLDEQNIIQQINPDYLLEVTFILGKDYRDLIPLKKRQN